MATRHQARQAALALLYANEFNAQSEASVGEFLESKKVRGSQRDFANALYKGVLANLKRLDAAIQPFIKQAQGASVVETAILRLSAYEFFFSDTPKVIIINEAIELAKELASENAPKFINAVLDKLKDSDFKALCDGENGVNLNEKISENLGENLAENKGENLAKKGNEKSVNSFEKAGKKASKIIKNNDKKSVNFSKNKGEKSAKSTSLNFPQKVIKKSQKSVASLNFSKKEGKTPVKRKILAKSKPQNSQKGIEK